MDFRPLPDFLTLAALLPVFITSLDAQVHYHDNGQPWSQRANAGPDAEVPGWYYNLGLTGIRAELVADDPRSLVVRHVFRRTPATKNIRVGDRITGANGVPFEHPHRNGYGMEVFGADGPVAELAEALEACQSATGKLRLTLTRDDKPLTFDLEIGKKYGSFSATYPADCPKSDKILAELLGYLAKQQDQDGSFGDPVHNTFTALAMLGSGERRYLSNVERNLRFVCKSIDEAKEQRKNGLMNWTYTGAAIALSEYHLVTKKSWVIPELEKIHALLDEGQYLDMSQIDPEARESHPGSYPKGPLQARGGWGHNPGFEGYGPITMITGQGALAYALMQRCGIDINRDRLDAAYGFLKRGTGDNGYVWYADSQGGGPDEWADMGRTGAAGIASFLSPYPDEKYREQALLHSNVIARHPQSFPDTHGSPVMGMAYAAIAANIEPANFRKLMDANRWWFTMAHCNDGSYYYQPNRDNAGYSDKSRMTASCVTAFIFSIPKKNLGITGKNIPAKK